MVMSHVGDLLRTRFDRLAAVTPSRKGTASLPICVTFGGPCSVIKLCIFTTYNHTTYSKSKRIKI